MIPSVIASLERSVLRSRARFASLRSATTTKTIEDTSAKPVDRHVAITIDFMCCAPLLLPSHPVAPARSLRNCLSLPSHFSLRESHPCATSRMVSNICLLYLGFIILTPLCDRDSPAASFLALVIDDCQHITKIIMPIWKVFELIQHFLIPFAAHHV